MTADFLIRSTVRTAVLLTLGASLAGLTGCSVFSSARDGGDAKLDYRGQATKTAPLEVPPDLTQLARDGRYPVQGGGGGGVSASTYRGAVPIAAQGGAMGGLVAPTAVGDFRIVKDGGRRVLITSQRPEVLWPVIREFWQQMGFNLETDTPEAGVMETGWAENRAKIPQDVVRQVLGRVLDNLFSTSERDRFRTRLERTAAGTEITVTHRGMQEVFVSERSNETRWTPRASDPELEAELLARLMVRLGAGEPAARQAVAGAGTAPATAPGSAARPAEARARRVAGQASTLELDEDFDRAWRRVGLALDRSGFTVEDRDRAGGLYYVRYIDPKTGATDSGLLSKLMFWRSEEAARPGRYRILVKTVGGKSTVTVLTAQGAPDSTEAGAKISELLLADLR